MAETTSIVDELVARFGPEAVFAQPTRDQIPTCWTPRERLLELLRWLKLEAPRPYRMLYDVTAIDERAARARTAERARDFTAVYHLFSFDRNAFVRLKVPLDDADLKLPTATGIFPVANWYEREAFDMFGLRFDGHPHLTRILMPKWWEGHPLRKEHPARATELGPQHLTQAQLEQDEQAMQFHPEDWGMKTEREGADFMFLNLGPQHPGTHGVLRLILQLDGEELVDVVPDIGHHHRAAEKMGERQTWHTFIPYTDRVDYLSGVANNLSYLTAVERLAGIEVPPRAQVIRVMLTEVFRILNHLVWYGTFAQDVGQMSPVFYAFNDRERALGIIEAICGFRMHPGWFRIGGVAADLPRGWKELVLDFVGYLPKRLAEYDKEILRNRIFKGRTVGVGELTVDEAIEWGVTGPNLRACGLEWDFRKKQPYSGYEQFEFDIPTAKRGDCYDRSLVRVEEMRQSLRIIEQCVKRMPDGPCKSSDRNATPPIKDRTMHDIETLITHFLDVSWGPVIEAGETLAVTEASKGATGYYLVSDRGTASYRTRIRTPSFAHMQVVPIVSRGLLISDLLAILGSFDYVLSDVDR